MKLSNATKIIQTLNTELLFGVSVSEKIENGINDMISADNFPCLNYIYHINNLIKAPHSDYADILKFKNIFWNNSNYFDDWFKQLNLKINENNLFNENNCILSRFSCINIIERILKYGKFKNNIIEDLNDEWITKILLLNVFETSINELHDTNSASDEQLNLDLSIISFNQFSNDINNSNYFRVPYLYETYIKNDTNVNQLFFNKYGYSIKSYILFLQFYIMLGAYEKTVIQKDVFTDNETTKEIKLCVQDHIFKHLNEEEKKKIEIDSYIASKILLEKPLLDCNDVIITINPGYIMTRIHEIFFERIKYCFKNEKEFMQKYYGPLFENYCRDISRDCVNTAKFEYYEFIEPFKYKYNGEIKDSSDFYIKYNDTLIIFEIKSTGRFKETTIKKNIEDQTKYILDEFQKKALNPMNQIENRLYEILNSKEKDNTSINIIRKCNEFYYVVVSDETIINNIKFYNEYLSTLKPKFSNHIPLYLNISELEYFLMSLKNRKKPIHKLIEHYFKQYYNSNLSSFVIKEGKHFKMKRFYKFEKNIYGEELKSLIKTSEKDI